MFKRIIMLLATFIFVICGLTGCGSLKVNNNIEKIKDIPFTVLAEDELPAELKSLIDEKKHQEFRMTYQDSGFSYICIGYGKMNTGGYSIQVKELYETANAVYTSVLLLGPEPGSIDLTKKNSPSYPFIVIKTQWLEKSVVFN
ncbi:MAG: protease complex subunit PrcB family protein [Lachnospiraceae bacterium]|nr:protease complex subunit PrcB family protein [Lachnospiraceae bacterium]